MLLIQERKLLLICCSFRFRWQPLEWRTVAGFPQGKYYGSIFLHFLKFRGKKERDDVSLLLPHIAVVTGNIFLFYLLPRILWDDYRTYELQLLLRLQFLHVWPFSNKIFPSRDEFLPRLLFLLFRSHFLKNHGGVGFFLMSQLGTR